MSYTSSRYLLFENLEKRALSRGRVTGTFFKLGSMHSITLHLTARGITETTNSLKTKTILHNLSLKVSHEIPKIKLAYLNRRRKKISSSEILALYKVTPKNFILRSNLFGVLYDFLYSFSESTGAQIIKSRSFANVLELSISYPDVDNLIKIRLNADDIQKQVQKAYLFDFLSNNEVLTD